VERRLDVSRHLIGFLEVDRAVPGPPPGHHGGMTSHTHGARDLLGGPEPTRLSGEPTATAALASGVDPEQVAAAYPTDCSAWAALADRAWSGGDVVASYAFARTGYHRGLDSLRRAGWKGFGPIPWSHEANRGFLRALFALGRAADRIGEADEAARITAFLDDSDPSVRGILEAGDGDPAT
jgi:hypothetical protein